MKKILLVDDEPLALKHIRHTYPWKEWGYEIVGEAGNGEEALGMIAELQPHIALVDITMPVMDGLRMLKEMRVRYPAVRCIMLTAHRDFDFAQQAIQSGAMGYILKSPIDMEATRSALDRASADLDKELDLENNKRARRKIVQNYQYSLRKDYFDKIISGVLAERQEMIRIGAELDIDLEMPPYRLIVCRVDDLARYAARYSEKDKPLLEFSMLEIVRETLAEKLPAGFELFPNRFGQFTLLIHASEPALSEELLRERLIQLEKPLLQFMSVRLCMSVSPSFEYLHLLRRMYSRAEHHLLYRYYQGNPYPIFAEKEIPFQPVPPGYLEQLSAAFPKEALSEGDDPQAFKTWLQQLEQVFGEYRPEPAAAQSFLKEMLQQLPDRMAQPYEAALEEPSFPLTAASLSRICEEQHRKHQQKRLRPEVALAKQYIDQHLGDDLSLEDIAREIQFSPSHLGHMFKKEVGMTVFDYILSRRIEMAKKYLLDGQYRNYELVDRIGFNSYSYFCTMFKKHTGMTPNEFKNAARGGK
ncbi:response regulator [Paenibacillus sp. GD4]|uniref:response regulator n=1 Tax=Paenibacillus sp. GD4 TaxID=3068890 RepID=UPI002796B826|nr:response regulator [Paenibacillus sp. GD4]MDQ1910515.1 response regulator [Paenibacillus sp. GD4]